MNILKLCIVFTLIAIMLAACFPDPDMEGARIAMKQEEKDWQRALRNLDSALVRNPLNAEAYWRKGFCYEKLSDWVNMAENYNKSIEVSDQYSDTIAYSRNKLMIRFVNRAASRFDSAKWAEAKLNLNEEELARFDEERHTNAMADIDTALIIDPNNINAYVKAALFAYDGGIYEAALKYSKSAIDMEKEGELDIAMREIQMLSNRALSNFEATIEWAQVILDEVDPQGEEDMITYLRAYDYLVGAAEETGKSDLALAVTKMVHERFPENIIITKNMALYFVRQKDYEGAKNIYETVLTMKPDDFDANLSIGTILCDAEKWSDAISYLERAFEKNPDDIRVVQNLMAAYYNSGKDDKGSEIKKKFDELMKNE